jgi:hypothetical protein
MFINEKLVYLALHKTGCSHVIKLLTSIPELNGVIVGKHNTIDSVSKEELGDLSKKIKSGNVRNPWDWYVSLWAFGSMGKGGLYDQIIKKSLFKKINHPASFFTPVKKWKQVYADAENPELFKTWLEMLLHSRRKDLLGFGNSNVPDMIGLLTYRYLNLYTRNFKNGVKGMKDFGELKEFDKKNNFLDFYIRNEHLEDDFKVLMKKINTDENKVNGVLQLLKPTVLYEKTTGNIMIMK